MLCRSIIIIIIQLGYVCLFAGDPSQSYIINNIILILYYFHNVSYISNFNIYFCLLVVKDQHLFFVDAFKQEEISLCKNQTQLRIATPEDIGVNRTDFHLKTTPYSYPTPEEEGDPYLWTWIDGARISEYTTLFVGKFKVTNHKHFITTIII